jgi:hypothetical protein
MKAVPCAGTITGPRIGIRSVAWRRPCKRTTKHPSGWCQDCRPSDWAEWRSQRGRVS